MKPRGTERDYVCQGGWAALRQLLCLLFSEYNPYSVELVRCQLLRAANPSFLVRKFCEHDTSCVSVHRTALQGSLVSSTTIQSVMKEDSRIVVC